MAAKNKSLQAALIISVIVHGSMVLFPHLKIAAPEKELHNLELTYLKLKAESSLKVKEPPQLPKRDIAIKASAGQWQNPAAKSAVQKSLSSLLAKEKVFNKQQELLASKPQLFKPDIIAIKKRIALTPLETDKISNASYISYYQIVREKIKRCAYQNYTSQDTGEIYLSFVISADGNLAKAKVIEEKSSPSSYLQEIALKSIKDASVFPAFPSDLDYPELSFNVIISFEIE
jgi:TonB family protein